MHGTNYASLHKHVSPKILPREWGGTMGSYDNTPWKEEFLKIELAWTPSLEGTVLKKKKKLMKFKRHKKSSSKGSLQDFKDFQTDSPVDSSEADDDSFESAEEDFTSWVIRFKATYNCFIVEDACRKFSAVKWRWGVSSLKTAITDNHKIIPKYCILKGGGVFNAIHRI